MSLLGALVSRLPSGLQCELKRFRYAYQIKRSKFISPEKEFSILERYINPGDCVLDIGANVGHYTLRFGQIVGPNGRVFAFEPIAKTFGYLASNVVTSRLRNVTLFNAAVSNKSMVSGMTIPKGNLYNAHLDSAGEESIYCVDPSGLAFSDVDFIKIDAEGHEMCIMEALQPLIDACRPTLMVECNDNPLAAWKAANDYQFEDIAGSHNHLLKPCS